MVQKAWGVSIPTTGGVWLEQGEGKFGGLISSISYTLPIAEALSFTGAFGYGRRTLIDLPAPFNDLSIRQHQLYGLPDWVFHNARNQSRPQPQRGAPRRARAQQGGRIATKPTDP